MPDNSVQGPDAPISRRTMLKASVAAGVLPFASRLIPSGGSSKRTGASTANGVLVYGANGSESSINPLSTLGHSESYWAWDGLTYVDPTKGGAVEPRLATSWSRPNDTTVDFTLRPNVKFSDGSAMTANDVKYTFETMLDQKLAASALLSTVTKVEVLNANTVRLITGAPDPLLEKKVALLFIVPQAVYSKYGTQGFQQHPVGTGKYMVTDYVPGQVIKFQANPYSWAGQPATSNVTWQMFSSETAVQSALQSGQIDIAIFQDPTWEQFANSFNVQSAQVGGPRQLRLRTGEAPFNDIRVRMALNHALDMTTICNTVEKGLGTPLQGQLPTQQCFGYDPSIKGFSYNPRMAKSLLAAAGYPNGFKTQIASASLYHDLMVAVSGYLANVGITATVVDQTLPTFIQDFYYGSPNGMWMYSANFSPLFDADLSFEWMTAPAPPTKGIRGWVDPKWDSMLAQERATVNPTSRLKILQQMSTYLHQEVPIVFLDAQAFVYVWSKKVHGFNPSTGFFFLVDKAYKSS